MKSGVILTSGYPITGIYQEEQRILKSYEKCLPKHPSAIFSGVTDQHEDMRNLLFPGIKARKFSCLGDNPGRLHGVIDPREAREILDVFASMRTDFVVFADREVVKVVNESLTPVWLSVYLVLFDGMAHHATLLGERGVIKSNYPF